MPFDPNPTPLADPRPGTVEPLARKFAAWVREQSGRYVYDAPRGCAFCGFLLDIGVPSPSVGNRRWYSDAGIYDTVGHELPAGIDEAVSASPHTYSALASRLAAQGL